MEAFNINLQNNPNLTQSSNSPNNNQPLVSLVNLVSSSQNNNNNENQPLSEKENKGNKKNDEILMEIDKIIGEDNMNTIVSTSDNISFPSPLSNTNNSNNTSINPLNNPNNKNILNQNSETVQIKDNHFLSNSSSDESYKMPFQFNEDTLNEPISITIYRDLFLIYTKLKFVINPFSSMEAKNYHIKQWDLWGPLLLTVFLASTLAINSEAKSQTIILVFIIFWIGSFLVYLNANFLGVNTSIFQIFCLLGYCLFPLNFVSLILAFTSFYDVIRFIMIGLSCSWSIYSTSSFLRSLAPSEQRYLVLYPGILLYIYIAWFIFVTKH